jgi:hypothetical protein
MANRVFVFRRQSPQRIGVLLPDRGEEGLEPTGEAIALDPAVHHLGLPDHSEGD